MLSAGRWYARASDLSLKREQSITGQQPDALDHPDHLLGLIR
jgi:hypothetical protein